MVDHQPSWLRWFLLFWRAVLWASLAIAGYQSLLDDPSLLGSWRGAALLALIGAFVLFYELFEHSAPRRSGQWPVPYRQVLGYLIAQIGCSLLLLHYSFSFTGVLFALMGQVFGSLERRRWPVPIGALVAIVSLPLGVDDAIRTRDWPAMGGFLLFVAGWVGVALFVGTLFGERYQREHLIAELREAKADLERYARQAEELAALRERARLARDMHDSLGHALVTVNIKLEAAQRLYAADPARGDAELEATRVLVRETMGDLRRSLANLRAELPGQQSLPVALQRLAAELHTRAGVEVICRLPPELAKLRPELSEALWRVGREALANAERHAAATRVEITAEQTGGCLLLRIADDGAGIAAHDLSRAGHYGITGMRERLAAVGGALQVGPRPGGGTLVEARVPAEILEH